MARTAAGGRAAAAAGRGGAAARGRRQLRRHRADQGAGGARGRPARRRSPTTPASPPWLSAARPASTRPATAGEGASDEENLEKLLREVDAAGGDRRAAYVCALALIDADGAEHVFEARCEGRLLEQGRAARAASATTRPSSPTTPAPTTSAPISELSQAEKNEISHRGRAARLLAAHLGAGAAAGRPMIRTKSGAAALSIASNSLLIAIKLAAGAITGSIAILTEAVHSLIDLVASVVAFVSVRKADEPADADHPYGHEKVESLAATIEGMLILVGAGIIVYEATHRLVVGAEVETLGVGIAVMGFSVVANLGRLHGPLAPGEGARLAGAGGRRRPPAHRRDDLGRRARRPRRWSRSPATPPSTRSRRCSSPPRSSRPGSGSSAAPPACSSTKPCPTTEMDRIEAAIAARPHPGGRRLPQAARPPRRQPPPHRPPRPVPLRHQPRARPRAGPPDARLDRGRDPAAPRC